MQTTIRPLTDEAQAVLATADRFCDRAVAPLVERPEKIATPSQIAGLADAARASGLLPAPDEEGLALWESALVPERFALTLQILQRVAAHNASVALHLHNLALGARIARQIGFSGAATSVVLLNGESAGGKGVLARFLAGVPVGADDQALLAICFPASGQPFLLQAGDPWDQLLFPLLENDRIVWAAASRAAVAARALHHSHGLNELEMLQGVLPAKTDVRAALGPDESRAAFVEAVGMHSAALVAIGLGAVQAAIKKATLYALERRQGGREIAGHAAMRLLIGEAVAARDAVETMLGALAPACDARSLARIVAVRAVAHPQLCAAANQALQVFGGYGYMKDYGLEKIVRDNNHLRLTFGTPNELRLWLAESEVALVA